MPFHFKTRESPARSVRRLCRDRVKKALDLLRQGNALAAVHDMRREIKKLRAVLRLVRGTTRKDAYRRCVKPLRQAASVLAGPRDARATLRALRELRRRCEGPKIPPPALAKIEAALRQHCRGEARRFLKGDSAASLRKILRKARRRLAGLKIEADDWAALGPGLEQTYRRGRESFQHVLEGPSAERFHQWRKRVKDLGFQFRLLQRILPQTSRATANELDTLGALLGEDHDLALLEQFAGSHWERAEASGASRVLAGFIHSRQTQLRSAALKLGARLYAPDARSYEGTVLEFPARPARQRLK